MGNGRNIFNHGYFQSGSLQCTDCSFTAGAGTLYHNLNGLQAMLHGSLRRCLCSHLSRIGSILSGTAESKAACAGPGKSISGSVRQSNNRIVKRGLDMRLTLFDILTVTTARCLLLQLS